MEIANAHSILRLDPAAPRPRPDAARRTAAENRAAATLSYDDARVVFAQQVRRSLAGGRLAVLRPHERRRLMIVAARVGLRPFDAGLLIAIAQDAARHGEPADAPAVIGRIEMVHPPHRVDPRWGWVVRAAVVLSLAAAILAAMVAWIAR